MLNKDSQIDDKDVLVTAETLLPENENAIITINSTYHDPKGERDVLEIVTTGLYRTKGNIAQISYQDSESTGFEGCETKVTTRGDELVSILRNGVGASSNMIVQRDRKVFSLYRTPVGNMTMGVLGKKIENRLDSNGGTLYVKYTLDMQGSMVSENEVNIRVELM